MINAAVLDAMVASGCTAEQIAAVVKVAMAAIPEPSSAAGRMRRYRQRREDLGMPKAFNGDLYRRDIQNRDGEHCAYCSAEGRTEIDHMVPIVQGGTDDLDNLAFACRACNGKKSGRTPAEAGMTFAVASAHSAHVRYVENIKHTVPETVSLSPNPLLSPTPPNNPLTPKPIHKTNSARGIRLPDDWTMSGPDLAYSISKGLTENEAGALFERFCSWAWSASGTNAVKRNWHQAWQGWVQRDAPKIIAARPRAGPAHGPPPGKGGFVSVLMDKHLERQNETGPHDTNDFFARRASG